VRLYRGHGRLAKVSFDTTNRLPFPTLSLGCSELRIEMSFCSQPFRVAFLKLARQNLLHRRIRASGEKALLLQPHHPTSDGASAQVGQTFGVIYIHGLIEVETRVKKDDRRAYFPPTMLQSLWSLHYWHTCPLQRACNASPYGAETYPEALLCNSHRISRATFRIGTSEPMKKLTILPRFEAHRLSRPR
jgi:hypothetical protein